MRAAYANGVLAAFEDAGLRDWDAVYGTSAGGALAAWFTAGQARYALGTWKYAADRRILSYRRWIRGRGPLLDHDGLFDIVYSKEMPLDVATIERAPFPVFVTVVDADTGLALYPDIRRGEALAWLRATGRLPFATGPPVQIGGRRYLDGGIVDPIPIARAIADGATDITLVLNRPEGDRKAEPKIVTRAASRRWPVFRQAFADHHGLHNRAVALATSPPKGVTVRIVRPARDPGLSRLSRNLARIEAAIAQGEADGKAHLARRAEDTMRPLA